MDKLNFDYFDFFGAVIPGIPVLIALGFLSSGSALSYEMIITATQDISGTLITLYILIAYFIGFTFHHPSYRLFEFLAKRQGSNVTLGREISFGKRERELAKIRIRGNENFKLISKFMALRQMAYSLFFSLVVSIIVLFITSCIDVFNSDFFFVVIVGLPIAYLFLKRAFSFHTRTHEMIDEAILLCD